MPPACAQEQGLSRRPSGVCPTGGHPASQELPASTTLERSPLAFSPSASCHPSVFRKAGGWGRKMRDHSGRYRSLSPNGQLEGGFLRGTNLRRFNTSLSTQQSTCPSGRCGKRSRWSTGPGPGLACLVSTGPGAVKQPSDST